MKAKLIYSIGTLILLAFCSVATWYLYTTCPFDVSLVTLAMGVFGVGLLGLVLGLM